MAEKGVTHERRGDDRQRRPEGAPGAFENERQTDHGDHDIGLRRQAGSLGQVEKEEILIAGA